MQDQAIAPAQREQAPERERRRKPYRVAEVSAALAVHQSTIDRDIETRKRALRVGTGPVRGSGAAAHRRAAA